MPSRFCDQEDPCPTLKRAVTVLLAPDFDGKAFNVIVQGRTKKPQRVYFEYCPFCGTRIDPKFLEAIKPRGT